MYILYYNIREQIYWAKVREIFHIYIVIGQEK